MKQSQKGLRRPFYPVGTINRYGDQKQADGTWKYIKKSDKKLS